MAEQIIADGLKNVVQELRIQSLTKHVRSFHGEGTTKFSNWLKDMDQLSPSIDSERMCILATLTLGGSAGSFVSRTLKSAPQTTWEQLRKSLKERYSDLTDPALAQERCRQLHQKKGESVQNFSERLRSAAMDAYDDITVPHVQKSLVETFQRGIIDDSLARKLIRKKYEKLEDAIAFATEEVRADRTFEMYRHAHATEEPMEIDIVQQTAETETLGKIQENIQRLSEQLDKVSKQVRTPNRNFGPRRTQSTPPPRQTSAPQFGRYGPIHPPPPAPASRNVPNSAESPGAPARSQLPDFSRPPPSEPTAPRTRSRYEWTRDGRPICAACGKVGHVYRQCRVQPVQVN